MTIKQRRPTAAEPQLQADKMVPAPLIFSASAPSGVPAAQQSAAPRQLAASFGNPQLKEKKPEYIIPSDQIIYLGIANGGF